METHDSKPTSEVIERDVEVVKVLHPRQGMTATNGFYIAKTKLLDGPKAGKELVIKGRMQHITTGMKLHAKGKRIYDASRREWQFAVDSAEEIEGSAGTEGIALYLARECPHIGDIMAAKIADAFGEHSLTIMYRSPERLGPLGINEERQREIAAWAEKERTYVRVKKFLYQIKLGPATIVKLISHYGQELTTVLKENPFQITELDGIGFMTACEIARRLGVANEHPGRIRAGLLYAFHQMMDDEGHTCVPHDKLLKNAQDLLGVDKKLIIQQAFCLLEDDAIVKGTTPFEKHCDPSLLEISDE